MQGSLKNPYKNFEMSHNFFGWGILEIFLKNPFFYNFLGPQNLFLGFKIIYGLRYIDFRCGLCHTIFDLIQISLLFMPKISQYLESLASKP